MPITAQAIENSGKLGLNISRLEVLERFLKDFFAKDLRQGGVIKVCVQGVPVFEGNYGNSTKEYGLNEDTIFPVASITKTFVSTLLHILQEDGLVDLAYPACRYLPEFTGDGRENIMLWHFLTHTSGINDDELWPDIDDYAAKEYKVDHPGKGASHAKWMEFYKAVCEKMGLVWDAPRSDRFNDIGYALSLKIPMRHKPRSLMSYSTYGYDRLKNVIDLITGEPIDTFARRVLFEPLGMYDTHFILPKEKWDRVIGLCERARSYGWWGSEDSNNNESGGGGLKTTVNDMSRFLQMLADGGIYNGKRILSKASMKQICANHNEGVPSAEDSNKYTQWSAWSLGWNKADKKDDSGMLRRASALDHGGAGGTKVLFDPDARLTVALFTAMYNMRDEEQPIFYGPVFNILYSAFE